MSSPVVTPRRRRSMAGPVVLIILGIVFLLETMGVLHWHGLGYLFARFWPLLLIIWGVIKLLEYQQAQREGTRAPGIGAGGVFLLVVLIVAGLIATQATRVNWEAIRDEINIDDGDFTLFGNTYNYNDELTQTFPTGGSLRVVNDHGAVNVNISDDNQIKVVVRKRIGADRQEDADKYNASTKPQITVSDRNVTLNANTEGASGHKVITDMDVFIPRKAALVISSRRGDVNVTGRDGDVEISNQHGDVTIEDINGNSALNLEHSSVKLSHVSGDVSIEGRANDVTLSDAKGAVRLSGEFMESVKLSKVAKTVSFKSARTDMEFAKLDGDLDLDSGDLRASSLAGPLRLTTRAKDIRLDGVSGDVRLEDENGAVEVRLNSPGNVQIKNRKGDIEVTLPVKAGFQADARARNGEIHSDFSELKIDNAHDQATATGTVGNGGAHLQITNEHGTIDIRKGSAVIAAPPPPSPASPKAPKGSPSRESKAVEPTEN